MKGPHENAPVTIVEVEPFARQASDVMSSEELEAFKYYIASEPEVGDVIAGTNGVRKVRWAIEGKGKSGGVRIIYYYHSNHIPLFLLTVYRKSAKANLTKKQRNIMGKLVEILLEQYQ